VIQHHGAAQRDVNATKGHHRWVTGLLPDMQISPVGWLVAAPTSDPCDRDPPRVYMNAKVEQTILTADYANGADSLNYFCLYPRHPCCG
jgi:hypothetical protein